MRLGYAKADSRKLHSVRPCSEFYPELVLPERKLEDDFRQSRRLFLSELSLKIAGMDKPIRVYDSLKEMKADEYRYWQSRPVHERMAAVSELTLAAYEMKDSVSFLPRSEWPVVYRNRSERS